ncbi:hypothetical protein ABMA27_016841 [Loxostege sticticalis]|uniref:Odorant receptor n=1 Tax=Loxostege sticticalis TaxID=481309 RepID=A0ABR3I3V3_LOXSC
MIVKNVNTSVSISLTTLRLVGFWVPEHFEGNKKLLYDCYGIFSFMFLLGTYLIIQTVDMYMIWGDLPLMTGVAFVLFTNLAQTTKIVFMVRRRRQVHAIIKEADRELRAVDSNEARAIVKSCNKETIFLQVVFNCLTLVTMVGWATSAEKNKLPLRAWYPYDITRSPAYELTYMHQIGALCVAAFLNVCKDTLVTSLIAQCRCRLRLLGLSLRTLCKDLRTTEQNHLSADQEDIVRARLAKCVKQHQSALEAALQIQRSFSEQTFAQFNVSLVIICVTAFQLVSQTGNLVRLMSMGTYLLNMMFQVFLYCYQGNQLSEESAQIAGSAYECPWYLMSTPLRRSLLIVMTRTRRIAKITAGGFTTLTLASFMAIIKASYSLFTLLQQFCVNLQENIETLQQETKMKFVIKNTFKASQISLTYLGFTGFWTRRNEVNFVLNYCYCFVTFMFMTGISIMAQFVDLIIIWGDVALMTGTAFLLLTNVVLALKVLNMVCRREEIRAIVEETDGQLQAVNTDWGKEIVKSCDRHLTVLISIYTCLSYLTIMGWATGHEEGELPTRAWYPYDTTTSPGYEITSWQQVVGVCLGAGVNISLDTIVVSLMAQCCCRLKILATSLKKLGDEMQTNSQNMFTPEQENSIKASIRRCVQQHQSVLEAAGLLQKNFSSPILAQFTVSMAIICVTAYQLAFETSNAIKLIGMTCYFMCMTMQVFLYCYHGHELADESGNVGGAVYESPWYKMSVALRRDLLMLMMRSQRLAKLTAGGITTLSLNAFMGIIKTSYTLFTVLQSED